MLSEMLSIIKRFYTDEEAAALIGCNPSTLWRLRTQENARTMSDTADRIRDLYDKCLKAQQCLDEGQENERKN